MVNDYQFPTLYFGVANVVANGLIMLRYILLNLLVNTADIFTALWYFGFRKTWRTIIPTISRCDCGFGGKHLYILGELVPYQGVGKRFRHGMRSMHTIVINVSFDSKKVRILLVCFPTIDMLVQLDD